ncbi:NEQ489 [Nanoarchaeum equitans Kin4-M]|uniref:Large ribosomal subunit protein eL18 n=1 Tax=Nanoarchaeum equitans (strain Kin4-M) TaxID=228908 RepID=RL18E_NANEQ|nr:RecName: Full=Large ribosomal subunit protein eL18; AltName: Full=50S ribosomal protein L18e [Nanoarchaeum equitans Kin4-M]AAR39331.1 NEQ489 [Nanoarchaeum equitans Kin4-M]
MVKPTGPTDVNVRKLIRQLEKTKRPIFKYIAELLSKPKRRKKHFVVNLWKIEKHSNDGDTIIVPGKVLGSGELTKDVKVVALSFSQTALEKLKDKAIYLENFVEQAKDKKLPNTKILI